MAADGSDQQQVTNGLTQERYPDWDASGQRLVFDSPDRGTVQVVTRDQTTGRWGTAEELLAGFGFARAARWSPVCDLIACATDDSILLVAAGTGQVRELLRRDDGTVPVPWSVAWAPDGRSINVLSYDKQGSRSITTIAIDGGPPPPPTQLAAAGQRAVGPDFATDGERFYFTIPKTDGDLWLMELVTADS